MLMAKMAGDVSLWKKQNETLSKKQKELENMFSAQQEEKLSSILKNQMTKTRTHNIEKLRDNANRLKQMKMVEVAQEHEKKTTT